MKKAPIVIKHPKPVVPRTLVALFAACLCFIVLYAALTSVMHMKSMYTHISDPARQQQSRAVISYLSGPVFAENTLDFLSENERSHMTDVKRLFDIAFIIYVCAIGIIIGIIGVFAYNKMWNRFDELLSRSLRATGWTILALCFFLGVATLLNFDRLWLLFHGLFFPQGNWMFPTDSTLITLYPSAFFEKFIIRWTAFVLSFGVVAIMISYIMDHMRRHEQFFSEQFEQSAPKRKH